MANHITRCVTCHADDVSIDGAYCSEECKFQNENYTTKDRELDKAHFEPREQNLRNAIEPLMERDGEARIEL